MKINHSDIDESENITEYSCEKGLTLPKTVKNYMRYAKNDLSKERIVYIHDDFVAYADMKLIGIKPTKYELKISNIRRKEYYDEPLTGQDKRDLEKIGEGLEYIREKAKYIRENDGKVENNSFTTNFI